ncbi:hypothetical protein ES707_11185 [subsurface metagenome]
MPSSTPAGILTKMLRWRFSLPVPRHWGQGSVIILPSPWHWEQVVVLVKRPNMLCWTRRTCPVPLQLGQRLGWLPGLQPMPWHREQFSVRNISISFSQSKAVSSKVMVSRYCRSAPRWGAWRVAVVAPPKKASKISPKPPKLNPSKPRPKNPSAPPCPKRS